MSENATESARAKGRPREFDRNRALLAAMHLFWSAGYEPASVADLCNVMDINPPSLYAAFGSKASLFLEAVRHYENEYWSGPDRRFMEEPDIYKAVADYFSAAARILLDPKTPRGCMFTLAAVNISAQETEIIAAVKAMRMKTRDMFTDRLRIAIETGQIPADTNVPALAGALNAFLEGLSMQARDGLFLSELMAIAALAQRMLPGKGEDFLRVSSSE